MYRIAARGVPEDRWQDLIRQGISEQLKVGRVWARKYHPCEMN